ncbi:uncharacterized protein LOC114240579 [Bombyx mandarina]|uniref:Uncharacterized protein LOC114240579 n=1 Tax=Bombyx mandarina TaxID=7092 RepID=A0A6J2JBZ8_BOMMA|nr:uncharacterized protein LOC114240579 [Bombyx mandarina]
MSNEISSVDHPICSSSVKNKKHTSSMDRSSSVNSYEVFRNNTTAVEVTVKEIANKKNDQTGSTVKSLHEEMNKIKSELNKANDSIGKMRESFSIIVCEMKKQLDLSNKREFDLQTKYLNALFDKEKMVALLESKTKLVQKLKNELNVMKRVLKLVIKGIQNVPEFPESCTCELDFSELDDDFKKDINICKDLNDSRLLHQTKSFDT